MAGSKAGQAGQAEPTLNHPVEAGAAGLGPVVKAMGVGYKQTWQPASYDSLSVEVSFQVDMGEGVAPEVAYELSAAYTGLAQAAVWERAIPLLERTGRIPKPSVLNRVAGSDVEALKWVKDTTGIPIAFRRQFGERIAAELAGRQSQAIDRAIMIEQGERAWANPDKAQESAA